MINAIFFLALASFTIQLYSQVGFNSDTAICEKDLHGGEFCYQQLTKGYNKLYNKDSILVQEGFYSKIKKWNHIENGYFIYYFDNGNKKEEGSYLNGKKFGLWKEYREDGTLYSEEIFANNYNNGFAIFYQENGLIKARGNFVTDKKLERFIVRFLLSPRTRKTGKWTYYNEIGIAVTELTWTKNNNSEMQEKENKIFGY